MLRMRERARQREKERKMTIHWNDIANCLINKLCGLWKYTGRQIVINEMYNYFNGFWINCRHIILIFGQCNNASQWNKTKKWIRICNKREKIQHSAVCELFHFYSFFLWSKFFNWPSKLYFNMSECIFN